MSASDTTPVTATTEGSSTEATGSLLREPRQARSRATLERILEATSGLLEEAGPDGLTVTAITRRARASVGSFYARFEEKDDLLRYLGERALGKTTAGWQEAIGAGGRRADLRSAAEELVDVLGSLVLAGPGRVVVLLGGVNDPPPTRRWRLEERVAADLSNLHQVSPVQAGLATRILVGILHDSVRRSTDPSGDEAESITGLPDADVLLPELVELLVGYLGGERRTAAPAMEDPPGKDAVAMPASESADPLAPDPFEIWE